MKTPSEVLKKYKVIETKLLPGAAIELAMKEYAKQWIDRAAEVEDRTDYITDRDWILRLKDDIDLQ